MQVGDLIKELEKYDPETTVTISRQRCDISELEKVELISLHNTPKGQILLSGDGWELAQ